MVLINNNTKNTLLKCIKMLSIIYYYFFYYYYKHKSLVGNWPAINVLHVMDFGYIIDKLFVLYDIKLNK